MKAAVDVSGIYCIVLYVVELFNHVAVDNCLVRHQFLIAFAVCVFQP